MKVFMIGGTGLLGSEAAKELIKRGHNVSSIALPPIPEGAQLPSEMKIEFGNYMEMSDDELRTHLTGCDGFVFAAGIDERVEGSAPIYDMFRKYNITPLEKMLRLSKECGVKHAVICGSYFTYFSKIWPELKLAEVHPYIRSRVDQEKMALSYADENFDVSVLELPYIFGTQPGRKPVWLFLVEQVRSMKSATLYPRGGSTMVTVKQVAQCISGALERTKGGKAYPVGYYNMAWKEMLAIVHKYMGMPGKKVITIPDWMYTIGGRKIIRSKKKRDTKAALTWWHLRKSCVQKHLSTNKPLSMSLVSGRMTSMRRLAIP
jgi:nucleoside-diphosphate-sugar epimerase